MFTHLKKLAVPAIVLQALAFTPAMAAGSVSQNGLAFAKLLGQHCPGQWESPSCLKAVSESNMSMVSSYGGALQEGGKQQAAEQIKQNCAASTAATEGNYPAYAMKSAFIECANTISSVAEQTGVSPDLSQYQLLIGATMCLDKAEGCQNIEQSLRQHGR